MSLFERWLTLWVALCILAGLLLGNLMPAVCSARWRGWNMPRSIWSLRC